MGAPGKGVIQHDHIAGLKISLCNGGAHGHRHRSEMHRHVVAHGNDLCARIEYRAGIIAALFNVGRKRGTTQRCAHFLGDGVIKVLKNFQLDGVARHAVFALARPVY